MLVLAAAAPRSDGPGAGRIGAQQAVKRLLASASADPA
jgi:hypothetical protein